MFNAIKGDEDISHSDLFLFFFDDNEDIQWK